MQTSTFTLPSEFDDGVVLKGRAWLPDGDVKAVLQISHGMNEHCARYERLAEVLVPLGYAVYAHDHRGHGDTAEGHTLGFFATEDGWNRVVRDTRAVTEHVRSEQPDVPLYLLGHSMGSFILQSYLGRWDDVQGVMFSGSSSNEGFLTRLGRKIARIERWRCGADKPSAVLTRMSFGEFARTVKRRKTDFDWLSRDEAEVQKYIDDPFCGFPSTTQLWIDQLGAFPEMADPNHWAKVRQDLPIYVFSGSEDPVHDDQKGWKRLIDLLEGRGFTHLRTKLYEGGRHEMLNETNRDEVMQDVADWLEGVFSA